MFIFLKYCSIMVFSLYVVAKKTLKCNVVMCSKVKIIVIKNISYQFQLQAVLQVMPSFLYATSRNTYYELLQ